MGRQKVPVGAIPRSPARKNAPTQMVLRQGSLNADDTMANLNGSAIDASGIEMSICEVKKVVLGGGGAAKPSEL